MGRPTFFGGGVQERTYSDVSREHLARYCDEFAFRYQNRKASVRRAREDLVLKAEGMRNNSGMNTTPDSGNSGERLKRAALWVLAAAVTVFMNTLTGMLITLVVMVPVFLIIALKTPRKLP